MEREINQWLTGGQVFKTGVELYERYGTSSALKRMFAQGEYSFSKMKLQQALKELLHPEMETEVVPISAQEPIRKPASAAEFVTKVREQMRPLLDRRTLLHNRLGMFEELNLSQEERKELATEIKKLTNKITPLYLQLKDGPAAAPDPEEPVDFTRLSEAKQIKLRGNLRSQVSKLKKNPARVHEVPALEEKIKQLNTLIESQND
ncbi:MAG: hypothetical protein LPK01_04000 [Hymenobacteraceae bacterium]|nr:hypothetical protein [Hymenobacteraceae bacterium]